MATINPYINFKGNTEEAFNFYKSVFGGEFNGVLRWKDMPKAEEVEEGCGAMGDFKLSEEDGEKIMHIALPIGKENILMGSDSIEGMGPSLIDGNNFSIALDTDSKEEAEKLFTALSEGGNAVMPLSDAFWGALFGMCTDKFGIQWLFNYDYNRDK